MDDGLYRSGFPVPHDGNFDDAGYQSPALSP